MDQVFSLPLTYHLPLRHFLLTFSKEWTTWKKIHTRAKKMVKIIITETKDRTHKQSMRFFCLLFYRKPTLSKVCWASRAEVTSLVTRTRFAVGFTRWHSADRKLQVANRRSTSNLYQTQVWYLKISDLGEAEVWYLVVNEWLKVHYYMRLYMLIGPFKCSQLRSRVRKFGPLVLRSTNPLLPTLRFSMIKIQIYHSQRLKGENVTAGAGEKKKHGAVFLPSVQLQVLLNWPSGNDRRCTARRRLFQKSTEQ